MIRIIRLLEYVYPDLESMEKDMTNWAVPPNGFKQFSQEVPPGRRAIRSTTMSPTVLFPDEVPVDGPVRCSNCDHLADDHRKNGCWRTVQKPGDENIAICSCRNSADAVAGGS